MTRILLAGILMLGIAPLTIAQAGNALASNAPVALTAQPAAADETVIEAISVQLRDRSPEVRAQGLQEALHQAINHPETAGIADLVPDLLWVMEHDGNSQHRIMAAQALVQIGDRSTIRKVSRIGAADSDRHVQRMVRLAVAATERGSRR
jgi:hypothetical protein